MNCPMNTPQNSPEPGNCPGGVCGQAAATSCGSLISDRIACGVRVKCAWSGQPPCESTPAMPVAVHTSTVTPSRKPMMPTIRPSGRPPEDPFLRCAISSPSVLLGGPRSRHRVVCHLFGERDLGRRVRLGAGLGLRFRLGLQVRRVLQ